MAAPWTNMHRAEPVFLKGTPAVIDVAATIPESWADDRRYAAVFQKAPNAFPWADGADFIDASPTEDGGQRFVVGYPLQECRACPAVQPLVVAVTFAPSGALVAIELLAPPAG